MMPPGLYIVATPIGNLRDITLRALDVLGKADLVACEDTRVTAKLLSHFGLNPKLVSYNDHNGEQRRPLIFDALKDGKHVALVSDAGTPLVSDPGYKLVREAIALGHYVTALPGASSVMAALCISGLPSDRFLFAGFLPPKPEAARAALGELRDVPATLIFFESARRLNDTLPLLQEVLGDRQAVVTRELTKLFEEARRDSLSALVTYYQTHGEPKGEVVLVVDRAQDVQTSREDIESQLSVLLSSHSVKEAAAIVAEQTGRPRKEIYSLALALKQRDG